MPDSTNQGLLFKLSLGVYSSLMWILSPVLRLKAQQRGKKEPGYLLNIGERLAHYDETQGGVSEHHGGRVIWIHAVSLGETKAAQILMKALLHHFKEQAGGCVLPYFLLTHSTATGRAAGLELIQALGLASTQVTQVWYPWDTQGAVHRFLDKFRPTLCLLMETEVWPNMVMACRQRDIKILLLNARLSQKSFEGAQAMGQFSRVVYRNLSAVIAQNEADTHRLVQLGAPVVATVGNIKFDASVDSRLVQMGRIFAERQERNFGRPIIMFASSRQGEEAMLFQALIANKNLTHGVQWLVVPRHPQRFAEVAKLATQFGFTVAKRTANSSAQLANSGGGDSNYFEQLTSMNESLPVIWLGDTVGEMHMYYAMAKVALLGGSFEPLGGQNLIEAAACACPVVMGPHVYNFSQAAEQSIEQGAAVQNETVQSACQSAIEIVSNAAIQKRMADAALTFTEQNKGALSKTMEALAPYLV